MISFLGRTHEDCSSEANSNPNGLFLTSVLKENPFARTELNEFVELDQGQNMACFLSTILYKNGSSFRETSNSLLMTFPGHLKFGALRFENLNVNLSIENPRCLDSEIGGQSGIVFQLNGNYQKHTARQKLGIFQIPPDSQVNLNIGLDSRVASRGSFSGVINVLGIKSTVNVNISKHGLEFHTKGKIHNLFAMSAIFRSRLKSWNNQHFTATGGFESNAAVGSLHRVLENELKRYSNAMLVKTQARLELSTETRERARNRLREVQILRDKWLKKFQEVKKEYEEAEYQCKSAEDNLETFHELAKDFSGEILLLNQTLNGLCKLKDCPKICQEGSYCYTCWEYVNATKMGQCPATCHNTKPERIPPLKMDAICKNEHGKRIHAVRSWFGQLLGTLIGIGGTLLGFPPDVSFAVGNGVSRFVRSIKKGDPNIGEIFNGIKGKRDPLSSGLVKAGTAVSRVGAFAGAAVPGLGVAAKVVGTTLSSVGGVFSLVDRSQGHWKCTFKDEKCTKDRFQYKYINTPYTCQLPCKQRYVAKTIQKLCCSVVSCASFVANVTCVSENAFCKKARRDALDQILKVKANAAKLLKSSHDAQQNVSLWNMKKERLSIKVLSASRSLQAYQAATRSLEEAYNVTVKSQERKLEILAKPLMLRSFFNKLGESLVKVEDIKFKVKVSAKHYLALLPIDITVSLNGTKHEKVSTIMDFKNINRSLQRIAKEILSVYVGDVSRLSRKRRSTKSTNSSTEDTKFYTLQTFHRVCSEFSNHKQTLYQVATSLYNLFFETQQFREKKTQRQTSLIVNNSVTFERVDINKTKGKELGIDINYDSYVNILESDPELLEAIRFQDDALRKEIEHVESGSKLLYKNWLATMENIYETISEECSGFDDCLKYTIDSLAEITLDAGLISAEKTRVQIRNIEVKFFNLTRQSDMSVSDALHITQDILQILENMTGAEDICAKAPNITKHPVPLTTLGVNDTLVLRCNATGDSLVYQWRFDGEILKDQSTNILLINKTSPFHSGNYLCEVSNHVAKAISILASVVVGTQPLIVHHPTPRRNFILSEYDSLHCQVKKDARNVTFQWWFRPFKSSSFMALPNETFSHLSFAPVRSYHEGWYFCNVSNLFGHTISKTSFVRVLNYTLPVPAAKLMLTVISKSRSSHKSVYYQDTLAKVLASRFPDIDNNSQRVDERIRELHPTSCKIITRHDNRFDRTEICDWTFSVVGENVTSKAMLNSSPSQQIKKIISATFKVKKALGQLGNETNAGKIKFSLEKTIYSVQKHSLSVISMSLSCPKRQFLVENVYKCGKSIKLYVVHLFRQKYCTFAFLIHLFNVL